MLVDRKFCLWVKAMYPQPVTSSLSGYSGSTQQPIRVDTGSDMVHHVAIAFLVTMEMNFWHTYWSVTVRKWRLWNLVYFFKLFSFSPVSKTTHFKIVLCYRHVIRSVFVEYPRNLHFHKLRPTSALKNIIFHLSNDVLHIILPSNVHEWQFDSFVWILEENHKIADVNGLKVIHYTTCTWL